jgi:hypothetical protein
MNRTDTQVNLLVLAVVLEFVLANEVCVPNLKYLVMEQISGKLKEAFQEE